jgi:hypothetical protein
MEEAIHRPTPEITQAATRICVPLSMNVGNEHHGRYAHPDACRAIDRSDARCWGRTLPNAMAHAWPRGDRGAKRAHMGIATYSLNAVARGHW